LNLTCQNAKKKRSTELDVTNGNYLRIDVNGKQLICVS